MSKVLTVNGDILLNDGKLVLAPEGSDTTVEEIDEGVEFIDYDGSLIETWKPSEIASKTALPENPSHTGLVAEGWNWTLNEIKTYAASYPNALITVGQKYITDSGNTEIDIILKKGRLSPCLSLCVNGTITILWGDNSSSTVTGDDLSTEIKTTHSYVTAGFYTISIVCDSDNKFNFFGASSTRGFFSGDSSSSNDNVVYASAIRAIRLGNGITGLMNLKMLNSWAFYNCLNLESITVPSSLQGFNMYSFYNCISLKGLIMPSLSQQGVWYCAALKRVSIDFEAGTSSSYAFSNCKAITSVTIPINGTSISQYTFENCNSLKTVIIPETKTSIENRAFYFCQSLSNITIPESITSIGDRAFYNCYGLGEIHFKSTTPPTVANSNVWTNIPTDCIIYIPKGYLSAYTSANNYPSSSTYTYVEE